MYSGGSAPSASASSRWKRLVRAVVVSADHVRDPEVGVVDDARQVVGGGAVVAEEHHALEPLRQPGRRLAVAVEPLALPDRPFVPFDPEPAEVVEDRLFAAGQVPCRIGVVDPQQHRPAEVAVRDRAESVADVERARRAGGEADLQGFLSLGQGASGFILPCDRPLRLRVGFGVRVPPGRDQATI